ncbi:MAG TPA: sugar transferase [Verrucomicrobiae bacterium]|jgi:lipopolysaccharide/colanic/teichoic acid biosynthesis glycosyltransferase|nr:sugar transferase [Verrucomicrobiae bacterium]
MEKQQTSGHLGSSEGTSGLPAWKRTFDLCLVFVLLPGLLLLGGLVALIIKAGSRGPIFFRQRRVGYKGREFVCFKFRTMRVDADVDSHRRHTQELIRSKTPMVKLDAKRDPRMVPLGGILRVTGLDELPQLLNIIRGEMSLVGPRPCIPYECEAYQAWHWQRFDAVPGLTGLWQVSGKNRTTFEQMVRLDIEYAQRKSLWLDARIVLKTVPALWGQYCDQRAARSRHSTAAPARARSSAECSTVS